MSLNGREQQILLRLSRLTLPAYFSNRLTELLEGFEKEYLPLPTSLMAIRPCFVTLTIQSRLRGCIGNTVGYQPLYLSVFELTQHAAFRDPRFKPIVATEVNVLTISITVLGDLKPLVSPKDLIIGKHGLSVRSHNSHGVLLAEVATKYQWTREHFLHEVCIKAGLDPNTQDQYRFFYFEENSFSE